jgi:polyferredoxin
MAKKIAKTRPVVWLRRLVQGFFLLLFLYLFLQTTYYPINQTGGRVTLFFEIDPLVLVAGFLANYAVPAVLLLSLITVVVTLIFGRWFCGWVCPFGVVHHMAGSLRAGRLKTRLERGAYHPAQSWKYYVLVFFLVGCLIGVNAVGWMDPISFFYRSLATAVYPAFHYGVQQFFTWIYNTDPGIGPVRVTAVSEPLYELLRGSVLAFEQPHYHWALLIGVIFIGVLLLNLYQARFWCRRLCPLGALLGFLGKNPVVRLETRSEACNDCRLCLVDCQGGANPSRALGWKPSECFFCWNCQSSCPSDAIRFSLAGLDSEAAKGEPPAPATGKGDLVSQTARGKDA